MTYVIIKTTKLDNGNRSVHVWGTKQEAMRALDTSDATEQVCYALTPKQVYHLASRNQQLADFIHEQTRRWNGAWIFITNKEVQHAFQDLDPMHIRRKAKVTSFVDMSGVLPGLETAGF